MGLILSALTSATGVLADQYKEYFYCDSLPANVFVRKGVKKSKQGVNFGSDNIITNGSIISVADGQCVVIVDQGKVVDYCAETGEYKYDMSTEPSLFDGGKLSDNIKAVFANMGKRFTFGGEAPKEQRIYYFNTKEMPGFKYGTPNPVPFRVVDERAGLDVDISLKCFGEYSVRLTNPILFYTNVCGNVTSDYTAADLEGQMKSEMLTALQPAFAQLSSMGIRYSELPGKALELAEALNNQLTDKWTNLRGIEIVSCGVNSVKADEEDEKMIKEMQRNAAFIDPAKAAAYMVGASGQAMKDAANNAAGAVNGFMGVNMAGGAVNVADLYAAGAKQAPAQTAAPAAPAADGWTCPTCGKQASGNFCSNCGTKKPEAPAGWFCPNCGAKNEGNFCTQCGTKRP